MTALFVSSLEVSREIQNKMERKTWEKMCSKGLSIEQVTLQAGHCYVELPVPPVQEHLCQQPSSPAQRRGAEIHHSFLAGTVYEEMVRSVKTCAISWQLI